MDDSKNRVDVKAERACPVCGWLTGGGVKHGGEVTVIRHLYGGMVAGRMVEAGARQVSIIEQRE